MIKIKSGDTVKCLLSSNTLNFTLNNHYIVVEAHRDGWLSVRDDYNDVQYCMPRRFGLTTPGTIAPPIVIDEPITAYPCTMQAIEPFFFRGASVVVGDLFHVKGCISDDDTASGESYVIGLRGDVFTIDVELLGAVDLATGLREDLKDVCTTIADCIDDNDTDLTALDTLRTELRSILDGLDASENT